MPALLRGHTRTTVIIYSMALFLWPWPASLSFTAEAKAAKLPPGRVRSPPPRGGGDRGRQAAAGPSVHYCTCVHQLVLDYFKGNLRYTGQGSQVVPAVGCHSMHAWIIRL